MRPPPVTGKCIFSASTFRMTLSSLPSLPTAVGAKPSLSPEVLSCESAPTFGLLAVSIWLSGSYFDCCFIFYLMLRGCSHIHPTGHLVPRFDRHQRGHLLFVPRLAEGAARVERAAWWGIHQIRRHSGYGVEPLFPHFVQAWH